MGNTIYGSSHSVHMSSFEVGEALKELRRAQPKRQWLGASFKECRLTREVLAELLGDGVDAKRIQRWETGEVDVRHASYSVVRRLCLILDCEALLDSVEEDDLFLGKFFGNFEKILYFGHGCPLNFSKLSV